MPKKKETTLSLDDYLNKLKKTWKLGNKTKELSN